MAAEFYQDMWDQLEAHGHWHGEILDFNSKHKTLAMRCAISVIKDDTDNITNYVAIYTDITELKNAHKALSDMAYHDALTGLPNRMMLYDRLNLCLSMSDRNHTLLAVCYIDLDGFKPVNDTYGHEAGDLVLKTIANRLSSLLRTADTAARMGGDEFVVLLNTIHHKDECNIALERMMRQLTQPIAIGNDTVILGASIGVSVYPNDAKDPDTLLQLADRAMYEVKKGNKNNIAFYTDIQDTVVKPLA